jgi:nucleotide-binding universal stress UspA family protein
MVVTPTEAPFSRKENAMTYETLMVRLSPGGGDDNLLQVTGDLAERLSAAVIGITACQALPQFLPAVQIALGAVTSADELAERFRLDAEARIRAAEERFRAALQDRTSTLLWRSAITQKPLARYLTQQARAADLVITNPIGNGSSGSDAPRPVNVGDIVMNVGRPVLLVPAHVDKLDLGTVLIGWKDSRETRRAVWDALPLLKIAEKVIVLEVAAKEEVAKATARVGDVAAWLARHGVNAQPIAEAAAGSDSNRLAAISKEMHVGLLVAGAYGHARLREWALGGVTSDLLLHPQLATLISH